MSSKGKKLLMLTITGCVLMFVWIFVAVYATGGRDVGEFTVQDLHKMMIFMIVEGLTVLTTFILALLTGQENRKNRPPMKKRPLTRTEKKQRSRGIWLLATAWALAFGIEILGIFAGKRGSFSYGSMSGWAICVCVGIPAVLWAGNLILKRAYVKKLENQRVEQVQQFIVSHREMAEETAARKYRFVKWWKRITQVYTGIFFLLGTAVAFFAGAECDAETSTAWFFVSALLFLTALSRIRFSVPKDIFTDDKTYIPEAEYPQLYSLAKKAADTLECPGQIRISVIPDGGAGIAKMADCYSVQLGIVLLKTLSQEEIYHILLHEFSHLRQQKAIGRAEWEYYNWLKLGKTPHFCFGITDPFFAYLDVVYGFEYSLYNYASSIRIESNADQAMAQWGNRETAVSALLKIKYYELFLWEKEGQQEYCLFEKEKPEKTVLTHEISRFHLAIQKRKNAWNKLVDQEILSRSASHPTMKMRMQALGSTSYQILPASNDIHYDIECDRALQYLEELIYENRMQSYQKEREIYYLDPKQRVESWEENGCPVIAEEYADIIWDLRQLGRTKEAIDLCNRAIETLPPEASHKAYFIRGCYRLHGYDPAGLEDIYYAIEKNPNYIEEGLQEIGAFCCLTGNQEELDIYREKAVALSQKQVDAYSQIDTLKKGDKLSSEQLPEELLDGILGYIQSLDEKDSIQNVYLVRKTITEDFFTTAVIIRFEADTKYTVQDEILHKLFCYLDTCSDWQFSLFDYENVKNVKVEKIESSCVYSK